MEQLVCKVTGVPFALSETEREAYARFGLPTPELVSAERLRRKLAFHNERRFFWRTSSLSKKRIYAPYPASAPFPVYATDEWSSDAWDPMSFAIEYNSRQPFFEQLYEFFCKVPRPAMFGTRLSGVTAAQNCGDAEKSFCVADSFRIARCFYSVGLIRCDDCADCLSLDDCVSCYECVDCRSCRNGKFLRHCENVADSAFLFQCYDCADCLFCANLTGSRYCIFNEQLSKERYEERIREWDFSIRPKLDSAKDTFVDFLKRHPVPHYIGSLESAVSERGNYLRHCSNVFDCFECSESSQMCDAIRVVGGDEILDAYACIGPIERSAQVVACGQRASNLKNCVSCQTDVENMMYCLYCSESSDLFGCIGLKGKQYCIFNKQYSAEVYREALAKIEDTLRRKRAWGKFFPGVMSDFAYNQSTAAESMALNEYQCEMLSYRWEKGDEGVRPSQLVGAEGDISASDRFAELPLTLDELSDEAAKSLFLCEMTGAPYQIHPAELLLYRKWRVAPPTRAFDQRHRERSHYLQPRRLLPRTSSQSGRAFDSAFPPDFRQEVLARDEWLARIIAV
ncbi:MAG: hypothetical protein IT290_03190 [Deltaproteobacteria bacterium]|nr:hypothetical protein [Deltaproteobacteria bacterium]